MNFTPKQKYVLLSKMGYTGSEQDDEMENFIQSQPGVSARMGKFQKALTRGFAEGGSVDNTQYNTTDPNELIQELQNYDQNKQQYQTAIDDAQAELDRTNTHSQAKVDELNKTIADNKALLEQGNPMTQRQTGLAATAVTDPEALIKEQEVDKMQPTEGTTIDPNTGQVTGNPQAQASTADAATAQSPDAITTSKYDADMTAEEKINLASEDAQAATSQVGTKATVQGQLEELMADFENGTPPWASGAMRAATAAMQRRGMSASSMAGEAITLAAMQAALPIAQQDAQTFAQREMANLSNEQQMQILKTQSRFQGILSDQAANNAAKQFNAASENQTKQFMASLETQVSQFNTSQINGIRQFNAGQENAIEQFNTQIKDARDRFNAQNSLVIAQANAQWRQNIETVNTQQQNEANRQTAANVNALTAAALDNYWQTERDKMAFAFQESENQLDRDTEILLGELAAFSQAESQRIGLRAQNKAAIGGLASKVLFGGSGSGGLLGGLF